MPGWTPLIALAACAAMLGVAVGTDIRRRRIPNRLVLAGAGAALALSAMPGGIGAGSALGGMAAGFVLLMPFHLLRVMGAGDVKLMAAVGAFTGFPGVLPAVLAALLAGGVLALAWAVGLGQLRAVLRNVRTGLFLSTMDIVGGSLPRADSLPTVEARVPYAMAIAAGAMAQAWLGNT
jgi:prepilin peptidase CpaA